MMVPRVSLLVLFVVTLYGSTLSAENEQQSFDAASLEFFEKSVRPLLIKRCYECHGPDAKELKGGLRLDSRKAIMEGGDTGAALVPKDPKNSLLIDAINYGDLYQMPPKSKLPASEIDILTKWVEMGAPWPKESGGPATPKPDFNLEKRRAEHWCWQPIRKVQPPTVKNEDWPAQTIDQFILARLEAKGLAPASAANRRTLIRRVYFDLIGLPPTNRQVEAFVSDASPEAFEKVVDGLLDSPHFGERWARHWMDLVRYAESYGHEFDYNIPHPTQYRDYLIRAFNADVPYDLFVKEHIAGDLMLEPRRHPDQGFNESIIGTGFWYLGEATHAPVDVRGDEAGRLDNQIDVMSKAFMGLTIACARCHDHKFDAISTKDYYSLAGFLKSSRRQEALLDPQQAITKAAVEIADVRSQASAVLKPVLALDDGKRLASYLLAARAALSGDAASIPALADSHKINAQMLERWVAALKHESVRQTSHLLYPWHELTKRPDPITAEQVDALARRLADDQARAEREAAEKPLLADFNGGNFGGWFATGWAFGEAPTGASAWDAMSGGVGFARPGVAHSGLSGRKMRGVLRSPTFTLDKKKVFYRIAGENVQIRLIIEGFFMDTFNALLFRGCALNVNTKGQFIWQEQSADVSRYVGHRAHIEIIDRGDGWVALDEVRLSDDRPPAVGPSKLATSLLRDPDITAEKYAQQLGAAVAEAVAQKEKPLENNIADFIDWITRHNLVELDESGVAKLAEFKKSREQLANSLPNPQHALAIADGNGRNSAVYIRGNHKTPGEEAPRQMLTALGGSQRLTEKDGSGRLLFAEKLVDPSNPLTARVMANRVWHHLFGRGIVASVDNFGVLGERPTHPELLDYLATQLVQDDWSIKRLIRSIVLSKTYRMSSATDSRGDQVDPQNLLLHRAPIRRLQGEAIRDSILAISGRLDPKMFGGSVPVHLTPFMQGRGRPRGGPVDGAGRRSIYTAVRRNFLPPMMLAFDTPIPFNSVGRRNVSNVPAQALIMMNDPFVVQQAQVWAKRLLTDRERAPSARIDAMYRAAFSRPPTETELSNSLDFLAEQGRALGLTEEAAKTDERVWTDLCHVMMNVKEFIFIN